MRAAGLVDQVDRLVGQEAVGDVAMRQFCRGDDRRVGDLDAMVQLVALLQPAQDRDGGFDARLVDQHLLEAALECRVLLDVLAVLVERGGADAVQFAARERGLQHVAGIDRAFGLAGTDHRVQLVDEQDDAARLGGDFLQHGFQTLLELAAILRPGEQARHVEHQHPFALQRLRHFLVDDALSQSFDDRGLADAGFADQHRVVLRAPLQDLDRAADLVVAADHRIELALLRALGQVDRVFLQRLALAFGFGAVDRRATAHRIDAASSALRFTPCSRASRPASPLSSATASRNISLAMIRIAALLRFLVGGVQQTVQIAADLDLTIAALDLRQRA